jgi:hypothetical protein
VEGHETPPTKPRGRISDSDGSLADWAARLHSRITELPIRNRVRLFMGLLK